MFKIKYDNLINSYSKICIKLKQTNKIISKSRLKFIQSLFGYSHLPRLYYRAIMVSTWFSLYSENYYTFVLPELDGLLLVGFGMATRTLIPAFSGDTIFIPNQDIKSIKFKYIKSLFKYHLVCTITYMGNHLKSVSFTFLSYYQDKQKHNINKLDANELKNQLGMYLNNVNNINRLHTYINNINQYAINILHKKFKHIPINKITRIINSRI